MKIALIFFIFIPFTNLLAETTNFQLVLTTEEWPDSTLNIAIDHSFQIANAEEVKVNPFLKNSITGNFGTGGIVFSVTAEYDRIFNQHLFNQNLSSFFRMGIGSMAHWEGSSQYSLLQIGIITGHNKRHFEASFGANWFFNGDLNNFIYKDIYQGNGPNGPIYETKIRPLDLLSGSIGYRRQAPNENYVFRAGIGWPETLYIGWGVAF